MNKMNKFKAMIVLIVLLLLAALVGCSERSSQAEAIYEVEKMPDFKKLIAVESIETASAFVELKLASNGQHTHGILHLIIYEDKIGNFKIVCFNGERPPRQIR